MDWFLALSLRFPKSPSLCLSLFLKLFPSLSQEGCQQPSSLEVSSPSQSDRSPEPTDTVRSTPCADELCPGQACLLVSLDRREVYPSWLRPEGLPLGLGWSLSLPRLHLGGRWKVPPDLGETRQVSLCLQQSVDSPDGLDLNIHIIDR